jgi:hypothetical protein
MGLFPSSEVSWRKTTAIRGSMIAVAILIADLERFVDRNRVDARRNHQP